MIEDSNKSADVNKRIEVYTSNNPVVALSEFKPNLYNKYTFNFTVITMMTIVTLEVMGIMQVL